MNKKTLKILLITSAIIFITAPWIIFGRYDPVMLLKFNSKAFRSAFGIYQINVTRGEELKIEAGFDLLFMTAADKYVRFSNSGINDLENTIPKNANWVLPRGVKLNHYEVRIQPKSISWMGDQSVFQEETALTSAQGLSLSIEADISIAGNAPLGEYPISINLPQISEVERDLGAIAVFPNDDVRTGNVLFVRTVGIHENGFGKFLAETWRWGATLIGVGLFIFGALFISSQDPEK